MNEDVYLLLKMMLLNCHVSFRGCNFCRCLLETRAVKGRGMELGQCIFLEISAFLIFLERNF